jgi:hypothetical protein
MVLPINWYYLDSKKQDYAPHICQDGALSLDQPPKEEQ